MNGLKWHSVKDFPDDYEGIVIVKYDNGNENCYGTYKFWPGKGIWAASVSHITNMAAINEPTVRENK